MKKTILLILWLVPCLFMDVHGQQESFTPLTGPYLGQKPPGMTPEMFAPGFVSRPDYFEHSAALFTPDGKEVYWSAKPDNRRGFQIYFMKMADRNWSAPAIASFCTEDEYYQQFTLSPDGKKLYYTNGSKWLFVEKSGDKWSSPKQMPPEINSYGDLNICSVTSSGSVYFIQWPVFDVYVSACVKGKYTTAERLGTNINSDSTRENSVFVAPDESYMIIEATEDAATCELFISFRLSDRSWSERKKLPIKWGRLPSVSPDGKYLSFMTREGIYWVSAKIIEELKP